MGNGNGRFYDVGPTKIPAKDCPRFPGIDGVKRLIRRNGGSVTEPGASWRDDTYCRVQLPPGWSMFKVNKRLKYLIDPQRRSRAKLQEWDTNRYYEFDRGGSVYRDDSVDAILESNLYKPREDGWMKLDASSPLVQFYAKAKHIDWFHRRYCRSHSAFWDDEFVLATQENLEPLIVALSAGPNYAEELLREPWPLYKHYYTTQLIFPLTFDGLREEYRLRRSLVLESIDDVRSVLEECPEYHDMCLDEWIPSSYPSTNTRVAYELAGRKNQVAWKNLADLTKAVATLNFSLVFSSDVTAPELPEKVPISGYRLLGRGTIDLNPSNVKDIEACLTVQEDRLFDTHLWHKVCNGDMAILLTSDNPQERGVMTHMRALLRRYHDTRCETANYIHKHMERHIESHPEYAETLRNMLPPKPICEQEITTESEIAEESKE